MQWELTEQKYKEANYPYDEYPDHRERKNFMRYCYDATTLQPFGPVTELIHTFVRVMYQGKEYLYTSRERKGLRSDKKTPHSIDIPAWEVWEEPIFNTISIPDDREFGQVKTRTTGVNGGIIHYLLEWDPTKFDELLAQKRYNAVFRVKNHGVLEPVLDVPDQNLFRNESFAYLFMRKWLKDPKYAEIAERVRYQDALNASMAGNMQSPENQINVADVISAPQETPQEVPTSTNNTKSKKGTNL